MIVFTSKRFWLALMCSGLACAGRVNVCASSNFTAVEIMQKAVERAQHIENSSNQTGYRYRKFSVVEELDATGKVKDRKEKVYEVSCRGSSSWARLLEVNGRPPARTDLKEQTENESNAKHVLGHSKEGQSHAEQNFLTAELVGRFDFIVTGETNLNGRLAYQLAFKPKNPEPPIHAILDRFLNRLSGTVWIDTAEFELARAQIQLNSEVDLLWGVVGSLKKMNYTLTRSRLGDGVWINSDSNGNFEGRKLLDAMRINLRTQNSEFRLLSQNG